MNTLIVFLRYVLFTTNENIAFFLDFRRFVVRIGRDIRYSLRGFALPVAGSWASEPRGLLTCGAGHE
jgi:hypothetical protein